MKSETSAYAYEGEGFGGAEGLGGVRPAPEPGRGVRVELTINSCLLLLIFMVNHMGS